MSFSARQVKLTDREQLIDLYKRVSKTIGGIARVEKEITEEYIQNILENSINNGVSFIVEDNTELVAEIHCYKLVPSVFNHVLSELTVVVDPKYQGQGLGKLLFGELLGFIEKERQDILRVELIARESNQRAINFYEKLGFKIEGRFEKRIYNGPGDFEDDIPMAWFNENYIVK